MPVPSASTRRGAASSRRRSRPRPRRASSGSAPTASCEAAIGPITWVDVALDSGFDAVLAAARTGAPWALAELYRDLHPAVLRYLKSQEPTEGEDIASEVWIDVAGALGRFEGHEPDFRRWV